MAERFGLARSIVWGGLICVGGVVACVRWPARAGTLPRLIYVAGVVACVPVLPEFWRYRKSPDSAGSEAVVQK